VNPRPAQGAVLAFDFGEQRIGVATGEISLGIAHALEVISAEDNVTRFARIAALITEWTPVLLVVGIRLGCLNHALLTAAALQRSGLPVAGWVANVIDPRLGEIDEDVDTLGGLTFVLAGHVPQVGEMLQHDSGWRIEVTEGDERRVTRVRLHAPLPDIASTK
jgi:hypothetical protein